MAPRDASFARADAGDMVVTLHFTKTQQPTSHDKATRFTEVCTEGGHIWGMEAKHAPVIIFVI